MESSPNHRCYKKQNRDGVKYQNYKMYVTVESSLLNTYLKECFKQVFSPLITFESKFLMKNSDLLIIENNVNTILQNLSGFV